MVSLQPRLLLMLALSVLILWLLCLRFDPQRPHGRALTRCMLGLPGLLIWNLLSPLRLGLNPLSAWIAGCLGLPGLGLLCWLNLLR